MNGWNQVLHTFFTRLEEVNSGAELRNLSDRTLRDIGLTRGNERCYSASPFWIRGLG
jgi:uncharacterized protein YjiS (DUF1127 family)